MPIAHAGAPSEAGLGMPFASVAPPQSTPVSLSFITPSWSVGATHIPAVQTPLAQSPPTVHAVPASQGPPHPESTGAGGASFACDASLVVWEPSGPGGVVPSGPTWPPSLPTDPSMVIAVVAPPEQLATHSATNAPANPCHVRRAICSVLGQEAASPRRDAPLPCCGNSPLSTMRIGHAIKRCPRAIPGSVPP